MDDEGEEQFLIRLMAGGEQNKDIEDLFSELVEDERQQQLAEAHEGLG